jgi:alanine racemase
VTAVLEVDLGAFARNLAQVRSRVAPATLMLVVKDDAYGHGLVPTLRRAWREGVRWFGAFDVTTGLAVRRELGASARIFVWITIADELPAAIAAGLDIGVGDPALLEEAAAAARMAGSGALVHLKIDSGLHRNGVRPEEWPAFVGRAAELEAEHAIHVVGVWSHLAEASDADDDVARAAFERGLADASAAGLRPEVRHLAASAASFARPEFGYDIVRVGAFCYGIRPAGGPAESDLGVTPIATLRAEVTGVDETAVRIGIGALHGLPSTLGGSAAVGTPEGPRRLLTVDETDSVVEAWPGARLRQSVTVYGREDRAPASATDLAETIGTIGEEIVTRLSPGLRREYRD